MTWFRIEGRFPQHRKVAPLSDAAFRLWVTSAAWSADEGLDGFVPLDVVKTLTKVPQKSKLNRAIGELLRCGLWEQSSDGFQIHDFLDYNPSHSDLEKLRAVRSAAGAKGGRKRASKIQASASGLLKQNASKDESKFKPTPLHTNRDLSNERSRRPRSRWDDETQVGVDAWPGPSDLDGHALKAREQGLQLAAEEASFRAHYAAQGTLLAQGQWPLFFTRWLLRASQFQRRPGGQQDAPTPLSGDELERQVKETLSGG